MTTLHSSRLCLKFFHLVFLGCLSLSNMFFLSVYHMTPRDNFFGILEVSIYFFQMQFP